MVNIKGKALRALRRYREERTFVATTGWVQEINANLFQAGAVNLGHIDLGRGHDQTAALLWQDGTIIRDLRPR